MKFGLDPLVERSPRGAAINALKRPATGETDVEVRRISRVDEDRMQNRTVGRSVIERRPREAHRVLIESIDTAPRHTAILAAKQPDR